MEEELWDVLDVRGLELLSVEDTPDDELCVEVDEREIELV